MRWAFWRRREQQPARGLTTTPEPAFGGWSSSRQSDPGADEHAPAPAFSGASPQPPPAPNAADVLELLRDPEVQPEVDPAAARADVDDLVRAVLADDRAAIAGVVQRIDGRGEEAGSMSLIAGLAPLGERFITAAGHRLGEAPPGSAESIDAIAEGDRVLVRAEPLLRDLATSYRDVLGRFLVRFSVGMPEYEAAELEDPGLDGLGDQVLVVAILLAQTCLDGQGTPDELAARLADLLPDA